MILLAPRMFAVLVIAVSLCTFLTTASAHPLGNFTINHLAKVQTTAHGVHIRYVLDIAEIPSFQIMRANGAIGPAGRERLDAWAQGERSLVSSGLNIQVNAVPLSLRAQRAHVLTRPGAGGLPTLYWTDELDATLPRFKQPAELRIVDRTYHDRIGWKDIVLANRGEPTDELRHYPSALLTSPRDVQALALTLSARGDVHHVAVVRPPEEPENVPLTSQVRSNTLSDMLAHGVHNPLWVVLTLIVAIGLGALHALEPGHGKTLLAVSLVGARATSTQALQLALALTLAHTAGVLALGIILVFAAGWIVPERIYPWITLVSGAAVAIIAARALERVVRKNRGAQHDQVDLAHTHSHESSTGYAHPTTGDHPHGHDHGHQHDHALVDRQALSFRNVVLIAMSGNIAPCPAALVVLLAALTLHEVTYGLVVIVAFSLGLAGVLTALGIGLVRGADWIAARPHFDKLTAHAPLVSAGIIATIGSLMLAQGAGAALQTPPVLVALLTLVAIASFAFTPGHTHAHGRSASAHRIGAPS